jgi:Fur family ferric uptake transcriptional regulator
MSEPKEIFIDLLKKDNCRITQARLAVFEQLSLDKPLSMHELVAQTGNADRASIYRTVELFERLGIVQRLHIGWKYKIELTDKFAAHHHHLTCVKCGKTVSINQHDLERFIDDLAAQHNFKPTTHQVELQGYCSDCQKNI